MGTRSDFYLGRGEQAEWLGSIAWDGYPEGIVPKEGAWPAGKHLFEAKTEQEFRERLEVFFAGRDDVRRPEDGWPWPWANSLTTNYAYAFDDGKVWASCFGGAWFDPSQDEPDEPDEPADLDVKVAVFPDMTDRQKVALDKRSGLLFVGVAG